MDKVRNILDQLFYRLWFFSGNGRACVLAGSPSFLFYVVKCKYGFIIAIRHRCSIDALMAYAYD